MLASSNPIRLAVGTATKTPLHDGAPFECSIQTAHPHLLVIKGNAHSRQNVGLQSTRIAYRRFDFDRLNPGKGGVKISDLRCRLPGPNALFILAWLAVDPPVTESFGYVATLSSHASDRHKRVPFQRRLEKISTLCDLALEPCGPHVVVLANSCGQPRKG